jgi:hypothetical protein
MKYILLAALGAGISLFAILPGRESKVAPVKTYAEDKSALEALRQKHAAAPSLTTGVLSAAGKDLSEGITGKLIPHWYGTGWDFNGVTRTPGEGDIACGYFITTLALDAGLQVERARLAQQPSSAIIKTLCSESSISRHWKGYDVFLADMQKSADGLYIVGLDFHCGFFLKDATGMYFIHSNYIKRKGVMKEKAEDSQALSDSKSFMTGCLSSNDALIRQWIRGEKIVTVLP